MSHTIIKNVFLNFFDLFKNSDKDYNIFLVDKGNNTYSVYAEYGKRGSRLKQFPIMEDVAKFTALNAFDTKEREKLKGGYQVINRNIGLWENKKDTLHLHLNQLLINECITGEECIKLRIMLETTDPDTRVLVEKLIHKHLKQAA